MFSFRRGSRLAFACLTGCLCGMVALLSGARIYDARGNRLSSLDIIDLDRVIKIRAEGFTLQAKSVEAIENGPVIVSLELHYKGRKTLPVFSSNIRTRYSVLDVLAVDANPSVDVAAPKTWQTPPRILTLEDGNGGFCCEQDIKPGDRFTTTVYVQHKYTRIPAGRANLTFTWYIIDEDRQMNVDSWWNASLKPTTSLTIDVTPATAANLSRFAGRIKAELKNPNLSDADLQRLANSVLGSRHKELLPIARDILAVHQGRFPAAENLRKYIADISAGDIAPAPSNRDQSGSHDGHLHHGEQQGR